MFAGDKTHEKRRRLGCGPLILILALTFTQIACCQCDTQDEFPTLWDSLSLDSDKSYHVLYQLEGGFSDDVLTFEEWANYPERLFRIDFITASKSRTSYLINGQTHEIHRYKPYTCDLLPASAKDFEVLSKFFIGFPWSRNDATTKSSELKEPVVAYGLGPFWLRVSENAQSIDKITTEDHEFTDDFEEFEVRLKENIVADQLPYKLNFFFPKGEKVFVSSIDWTLKQKKWNGELGNVIQARLKVLMLDYDAPDDKIFDLPIGFGCIRRPELDHELQIDVGLMLLHQGLPSQATFEVTFSHPLDDLLQSWLSQRYSMRMMRLSRTRYDNPAKSESFLVTLMQARSAFNGGKLARVKRVWWAPDSSTGLASVYEIDQETGRCEMSHRHVQDQIILGHLNADELIGNPDVKPMVLSIDQIAFLFADNTGYHLIDEGEPLGGTNQFRNRYYEKRVTHFKLTTDGTVTYDGPISIVKRISSYSTTSPYTKPNLPETSKLTLLNDYQTTLSIFFYSDNFDRLEYKIVIELLGNHEVSYAYAYQQLDITSCFDGTQDADDTTSSSSLANWLNQQPDGNLGGAKEIVTIKYPLESPKQAKMLEEERRESILSGLYVKLFDSEPAISFLSPLQLNNIQLSFDLFYLRVQLTFLELPLSQLFELTPGQKLEPRDPKSYASRNSLMQSTSSSAELCSQRCEHYNCHQFAFDPSEKLCQVELVAGETKLVSCDSCLLFSYFERRQVSQVEKLAQQAGFASASEMGRPHLSVSALIEQLEQLIEGGSNALDLRIKHLGAIEVNEEDNEEANFITLQPSSLEHELESMNEYERELAATENGAAAEGGHQETVRQMGGQRLKLQYVRLFENQAFTRTTGELLEGASTYEECELFCELHDCRSFSYCERSETCSVTLVHNDKYIAAVSRQVAPQLKCNIYTLDYLSKFEPLGRVLPPVKVASSLEAPTARTCANACMEQRRKQDVPGSFNCQGFYHCLVPAATNSNQASDIHMCYLTSKHLSSFTSAERQQSFSQSSISTSNGDSDGGELKRDCSYFSRSYLAQFDKYFGKSIELPPPEELKSGATLIIHSSADIEECAQRCTQLNCLAFDSCPAGATFTTGAKKAAHAVGRQTCKMLFHGVKRSQLKPEPRCTTFVLSDKSHFNAKKIKLLQDDAGAKRNEEALKPNEEADVGGGEQQQSEASNNQPQQQVLDEQLEKVVASEHEMELLDELYQAESRNFITQFANSSHWLARLFSLCLGVSLGCIFIFVWNEAYARGWIDQARQQVSQAYGQRFV